MLFLNAVPCLYPIDELGYLEIARLDFDCRGTVKCGRNLVEKNSEDE
jgi:hypothetical protein